ncbi:MAG: hypothetical protein ACJ8DC_07590 [Gemmatimonadales bacterium]
MADEPTGTTVSGFTKALVVVLGLTLVLAGLGVIEVDAHQVRTSPLVLFATGVLFVLTGGLAFAQPHQVRHPSAYRFLLALLASSAVGLVGLVTLHSHDERLSIGPFVFSGPGVDVFGKVVLGLDSLLLVAAAVWCWGVWWRRRAALEG